MTEGSTVTMINVCKISLIMTMLVTSTVSLAQDVREEKTLSLPLANVATAEASVKRLSQLYQALSEANQAIVRMTQQAELFPLVCRTAVEFGGMKMAWIGQLNEESGMIMPVASYGEGRDYLDGLAISSHADVAEGRGPAGTALREDRAVIVNNFATDPRTVLWRERAAKYGFNSLVAFPIQRGGKPFAVLTVYHEQIDAFDEEAVALLDEMTINISLAIDNFDHEIQRQLAEESTL